MIIHSRQALSPSFILHLSRVHSYPWSRNHLMIHAPIQLLQLFTSHEFAVYPFSHWLVPLFIHPLIRTIIRSLIRSFISPSFVPEPSSISWSLTPSHSLSFTIHPAFIRSLSLHFLLIPLLFLARSSTYWFALYPLILALSLSPLPPFSRSGPVRAFIPSHEVKQRGQSRGWGLSAGLNTRVPPRHR